MCQGCFGNTFHWKYVGVLAFHSIEECVGIPFHWKYVGVSVLHSFEGCIRGTSVCRHCLPFRMCVRGISIRVRFLSLCCITFHCNNKGHFVVAPPCVNLDSISLVGVRWHGPKSWFGHRTSDFGAEVLSPGLRTWDPKSLDLWCLHF